MLEPIIGLVVCVLMYLGVWLGSKVTSEFRRDREFERWCASEPIIVAFRCRGDVDDARFHVRALIAPHQEIVNLQGGAPWQYYRFDVKVRTLNDHVVALTIVDAIHQRGPWTRRRDVADLVRKVATTPRAGVDEVWMHGQLHPSDAPSSSRAQRSWLARVSEAGELEVHPMIGRPPWVQDEAA